MRFFSWGREKEDKEKEKLEKMSYHMVNGMSQLLGLGVKCQASNFLKVKFQR